jgi:hypothetical protein
MKTLGVILSLFLFGMAIFQLLLALGFPYGKAAWGGQHGNILPTKYRIGSAISSIIFIFLISIVLSKSQNIEFYNESFETIFMWIATVFFGLSILMNVLSRSKLERLWAPYVAVMFVLSLLLVI